MTVVQSMILAHSATEIGPLGQLSFFVWVSQPFRALSLLQLLLKVWQGNAVCMTVWWQGEWALKPFLLSPCLCLVWAASWRVGAERHLVLPGFSGHRVSDNQRRPWGWAFTTSPHVPTHCQPLGPQIQEGEKHRDIFKPYSYLLPLYTSIWPSCWP